jgi:hypothetical protein
MEDKTGIRSEPLMDSSLEDAATWLTESQGNTWTPTRILDHVVRMGLKGAASNSNALTLLTVTLPPEEVVGFYRTNGQGKKLAALRRGITFHIDLTQAFGLLELGHVLISEISLGENGSVLEVLLEPPGRSVRATSEMVRVSRHALKAIEQASRTGGSLTPASQIGALSALPESQTEVIEMLSVLRAVAEDYGWSAHSWLPLAKKALLSPDGWDGAFISTLRRGPKAATLTSNEIERTAYLTSEQLIDAFGDLTKLKLSKTLANGAALWLQDVRKCQGSRGKGNNTKWHPVDFALALRDRYGAPSSRLTSRFQTRTELGPWLDEWAEKSTYGE